MIPHGIQPFLMGEPGYGTYQSQQEVYALSDDLGSDAQWRRRLIISATSRGTGVPPRHLFVGMRHGIGRQ